MADILAKTNDLNELISLIPNITTPEREIIEKAYTFLETKLGTTSRLGGDSYIQHALNVAGYIVRLGLDSPSIVAALLHDVIDKGTATLDELDKEFGTEIAFLIDGLSTMRRMSHNSSDNESDLTNFKNLIFNATEDIRILVIRLAEKVDSILSLDRLDPEIQQKAAFKALNIYAPLAEYLNLGVFQKELEDKAFKVIYPEEYEIINSYIEKFFAESQSTIDDYVLYLTDLLHSYNINNFKIQARRKGIYSAFKKVKGKYLKPGEKLTVESINHLKDVFASRIIVDTVEQCYIVLGLLNSVFDTLQDEFDDYIAKPRANGYKSVHTLVLYKGTIFEAQIRTHEMHEYNEYGAASHIAYKLRSAGKKTGDQSYTWTKDLVKWKENTDKENFKIKAFADSIFVFTPKGMVVRLDKGSKPLDFAFRIHTTLGYRYMGARINGKMVNMNYELQTGDTIEIITGSKDNVTLDWLKCATMTETKSRIRRRLNRVN
jgi:guanosine-3',5'-bis(diphosphate) 3'-pyrophosphohydrolase